MAFSPLGRPEGNNDKPDVAKDKDIIKISERIHKTPY
jgi:hypothetical protein